MNVPEEVAAFLREIADVRDEKLSINPLSPEASAKASEQWAEVTLAGSLGFVVLEDANNSDPYGYVTRGPGAGMVMHLAHDGIIKFAFPDLASFGAALRRAVANRTDIEDLRHATLPPLADQAALVAALRGWLEIDATSNKRKSRADEAEFSIALYLPLLDPEDIDTLRAVALDSNFLMREAAADFMEANPRPAHIPVAEHLAVDNYAQVARPARRALDALGVAQPPLTPKQEDVIPLPDRGPIGGVLSVVDRPGGAARLTFDFARREGDGPASVWRTTESFNFFTLSAEMIEAMTSFGKDYPEDELTHIGRVVVAQLLRLRDENKS
jgi:hypothetical protein